MKEKKFNSQSGISLIEILIVMTILVILTTIAIFQLGKSKTDLQRQRISREFKVYLERARFDSVKRRAEETALIDNRAKVILNSATSFTATLDFNGDGILDDNETREVDFTKRSDTQIIVSNTLNYPVTIAFDKRGQITAKDASIPKQNVNPVFTICSGNCSATTPDATVISVSTTGTVAVLKSGQNPAALPTPMITTSSPIFNCYVLTGSFTSNQCVRN